MAAPIRLQVNRQVFSWAIARAGMTAGDVAAKYPKLGEWQEGKSLATVHQLKEFSHYFHFPFGYFFLKEVPARQESEIPFFRSGGDSSAPENINVSDAVSLLKERQEWLSEYMEKSGAEKNPAVGSLKGVADAQAIVSAIKGFLELSEDWNTSLKKADDAISLLQARMEKRNIIVTFNSVVNNNTSRPIPLKLCRGFCLVDEYVPFIFVNSADSKKAQVFTMLHELTHVFIAFSSGFGELGADALQDLKEALCDRVAAELLVPQDLLVSLAGAKTNKELSDLFKAAELVILRRKLDLGIISKKEFIAEYSKLPPFKKGAGGGGNFYATAELRISLKFLQCLNNAVQENELTPLEAYRLAGVKGDTFEKMVSRMRL